MSNFTRQLIEHKCDLDKRVRWGVLCTHHGRSYFTEVPKTKSKKNISQCRALYQTIFPTREYDKAKIFANYNYKKSRMQLILWDGELWLLYVNLRHCPEHLEYDKAPYGLTRHFKSSVFKKLLLGTIFGGLIGYGIHASTKKQEEAQKTTPITSTEAQEVPTDTPETKGRANITNIPAETQLGTIYTQEAKTRADITIIGPVVSYYFESVYDETTILLFGDSHENLDFKNCSPACESNDIQTSLESIKQLSSQDSIDTIISKFEKILGASTPRVSKKCMFIHEWLFHISRYSKACIDLFIETAHEDESKRLLPGYRQSPQNFMTLLQSFFAVCTRSSADTQKLAKFCYTYFPALKYHSSDIRIKPYPEFCSFVHTGPLKTLGELRTSAISLLKALLGQIITSDKQDLKNINIKNIHIDTCDRVVEQMKLIRKQYTRSRLDRNIFYSILNVYVNHPDTLEVLKKLNNTKTISVLSNGKNINVSPDYFIQYTVQVQFMNWYTLFRMFPAYREHQSTHIVSDKCKYEPWPNKIIFYGGYMHSKWLAFVIQNFFRDSFITTQASGRCLKITNPFTTSA